MAGVSAVGIGGNVQGACGRNILSDGSSDVRLKALEKKLSQLKEEKEKAARNKDAEKERKLEEEIRKVERQIEQIKRKEKREEEETGGENAVAGRSPGGWCGLGDVVDVWG